MNAHTNEKLCGAAGCGASGRITRGWCNKHYTRWRRHGDPLHTEFTVYSSPEESFAARTVWRGDCLEWTGQITRPGYGVIYDGNRDEFAHRYAYKRALGSIPKGLMIDHICHNRACCNVDHLRAVTHKQNGENRRGAQANSKSGVRDVFWDKSTQRWLVRVQHEGRQYQGGVWRLYELHIAEYKAMLLRNKLFTHSDGDIV